jgi:hypothetical protein
VKKKRKLLILIVLFFSLSFSLFSLKCFLNSLQLKAEIESKDYSSQVEKMRKEKWVKEEGNDFTIYKSSVEVESEKIREDFQGALGFIEEKFGEDLPHFEVFCLTSRNLKKKYGFSEEGSFFLFNKGFVVDCEKSNSEEKFLRAFFGYFLLQELGRIPLWVREGLMGLLQGEEGAPYWSLEKVLSLHLSKWKNLSSREKEEFLKTSTYILKMVEKEKEDGLGFFFDALKAGMSAEEALEYVTGKEMKILKKSWGLEEKSSQSKGEVGKKLAIYTYILMTVASFISIVVIYRMRFS